MKIETFHSGRCWRNRIIGGDEYPDEYPTLGLAIEAAQSEAQALGAVHVVRYLDGTLLEQIDYRDQPPGDVRGR